MTSKSGRGTSWQRCAGLDVTSLIDGPINSPYPGYITCMTHLALWRVKKELKSPERSTRFIYLLIYLLIDSPQRVALPCLRMMFTVFCTPCACLFKCIQNVRGGSGAVRCTLHVSSKRAFGINHFSVKLRVETGGWGEVISGGFHMAHDEIYACMRVSPQSLQMCLNLQLFNSSEYRAVLAPQLKRSLWLSSTPQAIPELIVNNQPLLASTQTCWIHEHFQA